MPRLLVCNTCLTIEKLPDYTGPTDEQGLPVQDIILDDLVEKHRSPNGEEHKGNLLTVDKATWDKLDVITQVKGELLKATGKMYEDRDTYREDAMKCFKRHRRPEVCIDWHSDKKRIGNPTKEGWRAGEVQVFLCDFCPCASNVMVRQRKVAGMYDE